MGGGDQFRALESSIAAAIKDRREEDKAAEKAAVKSRAIFPLPLLAPPSWPFACLPLLWSTLQSTSPPVLNAGADQSKQEQANERAKEYNFEARRVEKRKMIYERFHSHSTSGAATKATARTKATSTATATTTATAATTNYRQHECNQPIPSLSYLIHHDHHHHHLHHFAAASAFGLTTFCRYLRSARDNGDDSDEVADAFLHETKISPYFGGKDSHGEGEEKEGSMAGDEEEEVEEEEV